MECFPFLFGINYSLPTFVFVFGRGITKKDLGNTGWNAPKGTVEDVHWIQDVCTDSLFEI